MGLYSRIENLKKNKISSINNTRYQPLDGRYIVISFSEIFNFFHFPKSRPDSWWLNFITAKKYN